MATSEKVTHLEADSHHDFASKSLLSKALTRLRSDGLTLIALAVVLFISLLALGADFISGTLLHLNPQKTVIPDTFIPMFSYGYGQESLDLREKFVGEATSLSEGENTISATFIVPAGFVYNNSRASQLTVTLPDENAEEVVLDPEKNLTAKLDRVSDLEQREFTLSFPINLAEGNTTLLASLKTSFCEEGKPNACFSNDVEYSIPLTVSADATQSTLSFERDLHIPIKDQFYLLGTDDLGRDQLIRLLYAGRISLQIGFFAALLSLLIGVSLGVITGFFGGIIDDFVTWLVTTINSIPFFFTILIVAAILSPNERTLILVLGFLGWTGTTRLVRGETLALREREYVISARAVGASSLRIMFIHILPNLISIIVINLAIDIGVLILVEAGLSYLGVGVQPPTPTWGNMLTNSQEFFVKGVHLVFWPGFMIFLIVLCLYIIGDGVRDAFDPTLND